MEGRNDLGLLIWDKDEATTAEFSLGSRLKTPVLPIWLTLCNGHIGILFNPNRDLMRSYHAENRRVGVTFYNITARFLSENARFRAQVSAVLLQRRGPAKGGAAGTRC